MTIATKLQRTLDTKQAIKQALIDKGAEPTDVFSTYPALIEDLAQGIATPEVISPVNGASGVDQSPIITASQFAGITDEGFRDTHAASTWEFASDSGFSNILHTSGRDTVNLTSYDLAAVDVKFKGITVYVRVTYDGVSGKQATSATTVFEPALIGEAGEIIDGYIVAGQLDGYWILAAPASKRVLRKWGLYGKDTSLPNNPVPDPNSGTYNTDVLTSATYNGYSDSQGSIGSPAAEYCRSLGAQYDLPNREELGFLRNNKAAIDAADNSGGANTLAAIGAGNGVGSSTPWVWSSTEQSSIQARIVRFSDGRQGRSNKSSMLLWVVPVRKVAV